MSQVIGLEDLAVITALKAAYAPDGGDVREHNADGSTLGFGLLHYALVRNLKPDYALALGSRYGFVPACIALALKANGQGHLHFVDANYDDQTDSFRQAYGGTGYWSKPASELFGTLALQSWIDVFIERTDSFFARTTARYAYVYIDANHSYDGVTYDFEQAAQRLVPGGMITFHDALVDAAYQDKLPDPGAFGVKQFLEERFPEAIILDRWPGLAILQPKSPPAMAGEVARLRKQLAAQEDQVRALKNQVASLGAMKERLDETLVKLNDRFSQHDAYYELIARVRNLVRETVPRESIVLVVSKGDDQLVCLEQQRGRHFPQDDAGVYAGEHPPDSVAARLHLERLRAGGAQYLVFPQTALWWFECYPDFKQHLDGNYRVLAQREDTAVIYSLCESPTGSVPSRT